MSPLSTTDVLHIWEAAEGQSPLRRALSILDVAYPELAMEKLTELSLGQRDRRLWFLRERIFGPDLGVFVECPRCQESLEFTLSVPDICGAGEVEPVSSVHAFSAHGYDLRIRLPNSRDLIAVAACADVKQAREHLVERCVQEIRLGGEAILAGDLPEPVMELVAARLLACDPLQEVLLDLCCPACGHHWQPLLDIVTFFWAELTSEVRRLLREVHTLARAYGWPEKDILAMHARRRQSYLEMVGT